MDNIKNIGPAAKGPDLTVTERAPKEIPDLSGVVEWETEADLDRPIEIFEKEEGYPYAAKYFDIKVDYNFEDVPDYDNLTLIDDFVKESVEMENRKGTESGYKKMLDSLKKKLGIDGDIKETAVIDRLAGFIKAYNRIKETRAKTDRRDTLTQLYKLAKGRDFDRDQLALLIEEEYIKSLAEKGVSKHGKNK